jgi:ATP-dependent helicase/nuclease subunit B
MTPPSVFTISAGVSFVDALAEGVLNEIGDDPFLLSDSLILLPNRRSCRALRDAFLRIAAGRPLLLPAMRPIGETDEDELLIADALHGVAADLPPAIPTLRRQLSLAGLIREHAPDGAGISLDQAARLAGDLARLLDQVQTEGLSFDRLDELVPERFAEHWQRTLALLQVITTHWPAVLAKEGCLDPADRRNRLLAAQVESWRESPPDRRIIAAGSTGSIPAVAALLDCVAHLPRGEVVLPAFDRTLDDESAAAAIDDQTHPQYGMLRLLDRIGLQPRDVAEWPHAYSAHLVAERLSERQFLVNEVMRPAATTDAWRKVPPLSAEMLSGIDRIDCPGEAEEAKVIALALRQALENTELTAALVTPDRGLARRVTTALQRWNLEIDDSAGQPLSQTPPGLFLHLVAEMVAARFAPVATLAVLKHPFAHCGRPREQFRHDVRLWERWVLRGPRPEPGLAGLRHAVPFDLDAGKRAPILAMLDELEAALGGFAALMSRPEVPILELLHAHITAVETLADDDLMPHADRLWSGEAGEELAAFIDEMIQAAGLLGTVSPTVYPSLLSALMDGRAVRPRYGKHPRLHIWGPLEARLQNADFVILGGLNEGNWPRNPDPDPWLSRPMQAAFGLPLPERRIGLAAHDFAVAICAPTVLLTRSEKSGGSPTVPSRWLARLQAVLMAAGHDGSFGRSEQWLRWERALDRPRMMRRIVPPAPRPPVDARPRQLSVTRIETWMRDPYSIYARHILGLRALDALEADPAAADRGTVIHETLDRFVSTFPGQLPEDAEEKLLAIGRDVFQSIANHPVVHAFWWPRFERVAHWFVDVERQRRSGIAGTRTEVHGSLAIDAPGGMFKLTAVADRIDHLASGGYAILDYKTGVAPTNTDLVGGYAPQLPLEAAIAAAGGFDTLEADKVAILAFWRLSGGAPPGEIKEVKGDMTELAAQALQGLRDLVAAYDDENTAYAAVPDLARAPRFNDYAHLARIAEWAGLQDEDGS